MPPFATVVHAAHTYYAVSGTAAGELWPCQHSNPLWALLASIDSGIISLARAAVSGEDFGICKNHCLAPSYKQLAIPLVSESQRLLFLSWLVHMLFAKK